MKLPENIPSPDPSSLTTEQLDKGLLSLRELLETRLRCLEEAVEHQQKTIDQRGKAIGVEVTHLDNLLVGKFDAVKLQFDLIEKQRIEQKSDTKAAVDAALTAQKEAVKEQTAASEKSIQKSEAATKERIDLQAKDLRTSGDSTNQQVGDLKERLTAMEGRSTGHGEIWAYVLAGVSILTAVAAGVISVLK